MGVQEIEKDFGLLVARFAVGEPHELEQHAARLAAIQVTPNRVGHGPLFQ